MSFQKRIAAQEFAVLAEIHTPKGINISRLVNDSRRLKGRIDGVVVPDMDNGIMRMSALAGGVLLQQQGIETIIHMYSRDRNRMALQGDALAAHVLGIQNIVVADSDDIADSDHSDAATVYDIDECQFIEALGTLQKGKDMSGFDLDGAPDFTIGTTLPAYTDAASMQSSIEMVKARVDAGASYVITPAIFDIKAASDLLGSLSGLNVPIIPRVFLLKSLAIAQYVANSEPGSGIGDNIIKRIRKSGDRELEGVKIAGETILALKEKVQGVIIQTLGWEHKLPEILDVANV